MGDYSENLLYKNENLTLPFILLKENTMKKIARILIVIIVVILYFIYLFNNNVKKLTYMEPKLYPILNETARPSYAGPVKEPKIRLLNYTDKGIVFELVDVTRMTEPYNDSFYCMLTDDKMLKYVNGYSFYIVNLDEDELSKIEELNNVKEDRRFFEFQVLKNEYNVKLTGVQYNKIIKKLNEINKLFKSNLDDCFPLMADSYKFKGLCFKSGYFDARFNCYTPLPKDAERFESESEAEKKYYELFNDFYFYVQGLIPNLEPYEFGK